MIRRPPRSTRTDTLFPDTTLFRSRITLTALVLGAVMALEALWPRRTARRRQRWFVNGALVVIAGLVLSLLPIAAIGVAAWAQQHGIGLFAIVPEIGRAHV